LAQAVEQHEPRFNHLSDIRKTPKPEPEPEPEAEPEPKSKKKPTKPKKPKKPKKTKKDEDDDDDVDDDGKPKKGKKPDTWQSVVEKLGVKRDDLRRHVCYSFIELVSSRRFIKLVTTGT
jgi:hypothetical protein